MRMAAFSFAMLLAAFAAAQTASAPAGAAPAASPAAATPPGAPAPDAGTDAPKPPPGGPHRIIILSPQPPPEGAPARIVPPPPAPPPPPPAPAEPAPPPAEEAAPPPAPPASTAPPAKFDFDLSGYLRLGGGVAQADARAPFIGQSDGFRLLSARVLLFGALGNRVTFELSVDGAEDPGAPPEEGVLARLFALRDAFAQVRLTDSLYVRFCQSKVPFDAEGLWSTSRLQFVSRSIVAEGLDDRDWLVAAPGLGMGRELGVAMGGGVALGGLFVEYEVAGVNGNGANRADNDNAKIAGAGRLKLTVPMGPARVELGGAGLYNPASTGVLPNRFEERRIGWTGDVTLVWDGLRAFGAAVGRRMQNVDANLDPTSALGFVGQVSYRFASLGLEPTYRFAWLDPDSAFQGDRATTHTIGLNWYASDLPLRAVLHYTLRGEEAARAVDNDAIEGMVQVSF